VIMLTKKQVTILKTGNRIAEQIMVKQQARG